MFLDVRKYGDRERNGESGLTRRLSSRYYIRWRLSGSPPVEGMSV